jgi:hypothetical protein
MEDDPLFLSFSLWRRDAGSWRSCEATQPSDRAEGHALAVCVVLSQPLRQDERLVPSQSTPIAPESLS